MALGLLLVDFNELDDDGLLIALLPPESPAPDSGTKFHLLDADGNYCRGTISSVEGRLVSLVLDWSTWWPEDGAGWEVARHSVTGWVIVTQSRAVYPPERRESLNVVADRSTGAGPFEEAALTYAP
ncbi:MAG: hypothetical protein JO115_18795 [Pseudonocardiales bacterium]|nr:hypothetical protein [Pseudonocardiales bacterium]